MLHFDTVWKQIVAYFFNKINIYNKLTRTFIAFIHLSYNWCFKMFFVICSLTHKLCYFKCNCVLLNINLTRNI